jgi:hypothetical protein
MILLIEIAMKRCLSSPTKHVLRISKRCVLASLLLQLLELLQAKRFKRRIDMFEMNVERAKTIDLCR